MNLSLFLFCFYLFICTRGLPLQDTPDDTLQPAFKRANGAAVNVNIVQHFFNTLNPHLTQLLISNLNNFQLEDAQFEIPVPLVGDIVFKAYNMRVVNASVVSPSVFTILDGKVQIKFDEIDFKMLGDYQVTWGSSKTVGTISVDNQASIVGDLEIKSNSQGSIKAGLKDMATPFKTFKVAVSNSTLLNWLVRVSNLIFGGALRRVLGLVLSTTTKEVLVPVVNMLLSNQISLGVGTQVGTTVLSTKLVQEPRITMEDGIHLAIGLVVRQSNVQT